MMTRGYFGIGVEGISKPMNVGNLLRSAHSFGASFFFTIAPSVDLDGMKSSDTSDAFGHIPFYNFEKHEDLLLPQNTALVAVELVEGGGRSAKLPPSDPRCLCIGAGKGQRLG
jgi:tRNA G18 (ribose-2'-O)-methylase SpoU